MTTASFLPTTPSAGRRPSHLVIACLVATWLIWGSASLAIKFALAGFAPFFQMGTRFVVAGGVLMAWTRLRGAAWPSRLQWRNSVLVGALMLGGGMGCSALAEQTVGSGLVVAFAAISPLLFATVNLFFGVRTSRMEALGIAVGVAGVLMLTQGRSFQASPSGLLAIATACLSWSIGSVLSQQRLPLAPGPMGFASEMLCGGGVLLAISASRGEAMLLPTTAAPWLAWAYLVIFGSLVAFSAYMVLLARVSPALATSYSFVNPLIAMFLGVALGGESVTPFEWRSVAVILGGVVLLICRRR